MKSKFSSHDIINLSNAKYNIHISSHGIETENVQLFQALTLMSILSAGKGKKRYMGIHIAYVTHLLFLCIEYVCWIYLYRVFYVHDYTLPKFRKTFIAFTVGVFSFQELHELAFSSRMSWVGNSRKPQKLLQPAMIIFTFCKNRKLKVEPNSQFKK